MARLQLRRRTALAWLVGLALLSPACRDAAGQVGWGSEWTRADRHAAERLRREAAVRGDAFRRERAREGGVAARVPARSAEDGPMEAWLTDRVVELAGDGSERLSREFEAAIEAAGDDARERMHAEFERGREALREAWREVVAQFGRSDDG